MRAIRQERQMLGSLTLGRDGTATSPLDGDATDRKVREFYIPNGSGDFPR